MKKFLKLALAAFIFCSMAKVGFAQTIGDYLKENDVEVNVSGAVDFYNQYIWRGFQLDSDPVVQPSVTISVAGFEGGFWGSWDVDQDDGEARNSDEVDGWISYNFDLGFVDESLEMVGVSVGNTWYAFPGTDTHTEELYVGLSFDTFLSPYFTWYHDYGDESSGGADGNYYMLGIGHSFNIYEEYGITLDLGYELSFNNEAFIAGDGGYNMFTAGVTVPIHEGVTMSPNIGYVIPFGDLEDESDGNQEEEFWVGVSTAFGF